MKYLSPFLLFLLLTACGLLSKISDADRKFGEGKYKEAAQDYTKMIEGEKNVGVLASLYNRRGLCYLQTGEPNKALTDFEWSVQLNPNVSTYIEGKADAHLMMGYYREAEAEYTQAIALDNERAELYCKRASNYRGMQFYDLAQKDIEKAMELNSDNSDFLYEQGLIYMAIHRKDLACSTMKKAKAAGNKYAEKWLEKADCI